MNETAYLRAPTFHGPTYRSYPRENITCHLAANPGTTSVADAGTFPHQAQPFLDEGPTHPCFFYAPVAHVPRTSAEVGLLVFCGVDRYQYKLLGIYRWLPCV